MKQLKNVFVFLLAALTFTACEEEEVISYVLQDISAPTNVNAIFDIAQDESGEVSVTPTAVGASTFEVYFGDQDNETPTQVAAGETVTHVYSEGEFLLRVVAIGPTGLTSELNRVITIAFTPPTNLEFDVEISQANPFEVSVTPAADDATVFDIFWGDETDGVPTTIMAGQTATHIYAEEGDYTVRVIARSASATTLEVSTTVSITGASDPIALPITFDSPTVNYAFGTFNGASYEVVDNPDESGANATASKVGAITNTGNAFEGGFFNLGTPVDFSGDNKTITMKFWSNVPVPVLLKFEGGVNDERQTEVVADHGGTGWEELSFDFAVDAIKSFIDGSQGVGEPFVPTGQYATLVLFVDGPGNTAGTFYMDDIAQTTGGGGGSNLLELPLTFDLAAVDYTPTTFNGASFEIVANPDQSGANAAATDVAAITNSGVNWEGLFWELDTPVDFSGDNKTVTMKLWSTVSLPILLKFEGGVNGERQNEVTATHGGTGWEDLSFDFAVDAVKSFIDGSQGVGEPFVPTGQYGTLTLFIDGPGTTPGTFYLDDVAKAGDNGGGGGGGPMAPTAGPAAPSQAEADVISIYSDSYTDNPREGFNFYGAAAFEEVDLGGNMALKYTFADVGGGNFQVLELGGANQIDATAAGMTNFRFDVWFPNEVAADTEALFKLVDFGASTTEAVLNVNSSSNPAIAQGQWLSFDFTMAELMTAGLGASSNIQQFVIDLINSGELYLDNIYFYNANGGASSIPPTMGPAAPSQAEADVISIYSDSYTDNPREGFNFYGAAAFEEVDLGGNMALKYTFADVGGGNFQVLELGGANQIDATAAGMTNFRFDLWFPNAVAADTQALFKLVDFGASTTEAILTVNNASNPAIAQGQWLSFDYTMADLMTAGLGASSNIQQFVIDLINSGEVYIDNIYFYNANPGAGGSLELPLTFDDGTVDYTPTVFNGASFEVVANPDQSGANTSASNVGAITNTGNAFEGLFWNLDTPVDFSGTDKTITIKIWSNVATPILLKFEGGVSGERQNEVVANHGGTGWEDISFNFAEDAVKSFIDGSQGVGEPFVPTGQYGTITMFFDGPGTTAGTFYVDDFTQVESGGGGGGSTLELPLTFDDGALDYTPTVFNGASFEVVANPDQSGANTSASNVGAITNTGNAFEGLFWNLDTPVDFSGSNKTITIKFWSNVATPILLKFEGGVNGERQNEVVANHGGTGWEEISFDFANDAVKSFIDGSQGVGEPFVPTGQYATITMFVDGPGTTAGTFYIDDVTQQ